MPIHDGGEGLGQIPSGFLRAKKAEGSRLQIASQQHVTGVGGYPGIGGRMKLEQVGASDRNRWAHHPGIRRHWEALAREIGYRPTDVKNRVQQIVDVLVANRVKITAEVSARPGATKGYVAQTAKAVEANLLRMAGRL